MRISEIKCGCGASVEARYVTINANGIKRDWFIMCINCGLRTSYWFTKKQAVACFIKATRFKDK